jgi:hypothetical protein
MKKSLVFIALIGFSFLGFAQTSSDKITLLTSKTWEISTETMSGVGVHHSLPKGTEIKFMPNGTWQSSQPMETKEGTWELKKDNILLLKFGSETKFSKVKLLLLNDKELHYQTNDKAARYIFKWKAE